MKVKVYAKLNLTLNISGVKNGYHDIDSIAVSTDIYDIVEVEKRNDRAVNVWGQAEIQTEHNTAYKAACAFITVFGTNGADIRISKNIPMSAGMGGSSADAAAVIYCMCKLNNIDVNSYRVYEICSSIGSDVNFMLRGGLGRMSGKGDDVIFYGMTDTLYFALTTFNVGVSSAQAYVRFDNLTTKPVCTDNGKIIKLFESGQVKQAVKLFNNNLQAAVETISDYAFNYLQYCRAQQLLCNMTGSGSAYYIAFDNEQEANNVAEKLSQNGFDTRVCRSVLRGIEEI